MKSFIFAFSVAHGIVVPRIPDIIDCPGRCWEKVDGHCLPAVGKVSNFYLPNFFLTKFSFVKKKYCCQNYNVSKFTFVKICFYQTFLSKKEIFCQNFLLSKFYFGIKSSILVLTNVLIFTKSWDFAKISLLRKFHFCENFTFAKISLFRKFHFCQNFTFAKISLFRKFHFAKISPFLNQF